MSSRLELFAIPGFPMVREGDDLPALIADGAGRAGLTLQDRDVVVLAQKIVSKAEGRSVDLASVVPSAEAEKLAAEVGKDPRLVQVVLSDSVKVVRSRPNLMIMQHRLGFVMANAGIDQSNVPGGDEAVLLLPENPDASAQRLRNQLREQSGVAVAVLIIDSFGRAWRNGVTGTAIGVAGMPALVDLRGEKDREGRMLKVTQVAAADELAAAASLVMGQADEGTPAVLVRGFPYALRESGVHELLRPEAEDLFR